MTGVGTTSAAESGHVVHLYDRDDRSLIRSVARYLGEALQRDGRALAVVTAAHRSGLIAELRAQGIGVESALASGSLEVLDATWGLQSFLINEYPDTQRFFTNIGGRVRRLAASPGGLRVYGEMVGLLWLGRQYPAAVRLEQLWNRLLRTVAFELYCGYPIDVFESEFRSPIVGGLVSAHANVHTGDEHGALDAALDRAVNELAPSSRYPRLSSAEAKILWLRDHAPRDAEAVIARARRYYDEKPRLTGKTTRISVP